MNTNAPKSAQLNASGREPTRRMRAAMGTFCVVEARADTYEKELSATELALRIIEDIAVRMHPSHANSDVAAINRSGVGARVEVDPSTHRVLTLANELNKLSNGIFDPCLPTRPGRLSDLLLDDRNGVICTAQVALDLGGIAKGYAVDCAVECLRAAGSSGGLVNIGGDLRCFGTEPHEIVIRIPPDDARSVTLLNSAVAVSTVESPDRPPEHSGYYSRTHNQTPQSEFALVIAPTTALADALTKCALFCSEAEMTVLAEKFDASWIRGESR